MNNSQKITDILNQRRPLAQKTVKVRENIKNVLQKLIQLENYRQRIINKIGECETTNKLEKVQLVTLGEALKSELNKLDKIVTRFSRKTLNIGVIGRAGQGKSTLLQNITGLGSLEIPDGCLDYCTGAICTIYHKPNIDTYAEVYFHNEHSFLAEIITPYYEKLKLGAVPKTITEFAELSIPLLLDEDAEAKLMYEHLEQYHRHLSKYAQLLIGSSPITIPQSKIREYIARDNLTGERVYYNYLAVKEVKVYCSFPNSEIEKVALIDCPGLGDTGVGEKERLMRTLGEDIDVVLFVKMPAKGKRPWEEIDVQLYDSVRKSLPELPLNLWSYMIFNRLDDSSNDQLCNYCQETIAEKKIEVAQTIIANCSDPQEVREKILAPILEDLDRNITTLDRQYARLSQEKLLKLQQEIATELEKASQIVQLNRGKRLFKRSFNTLWTDVTNSLEELLEEVKIRRHHKDEHFQQQVETILETCRTDNRLPASVLEIEKVKRELGTYTNAYCYFLSRIRTYLSWQLLSLNDSIQESIDRVKSNIAENLVATGLGGLSDNRGSDFLLALSSLLPQDLANLHFGFKTIAQYNVAYAGIIQNKLRPHLDLLSPDRTPLTFSVPLAYEVLLESLEQIPAERRKEIKQQSTTYEEFQSLIRQEVKQNNVTLTLEQETSLFIPNPEMNTEVLLNKLQTIYSRVIQQCEANLQELLQEPNQIIYSMTAEFVDRVLYAENVRDEWEIFLDTPTIRTGVWREFKHLKQLEEQHREWLDLINDIKAVNQDSYFSFIAKDKSGDRK